MAFNINKSMRANYEQFGVEEYYKKVGGASNSYRNPHFSAVRACLWTWLNRWWEHEASQGGNGTINPLELRIFDLAAGSGEATIAVQEWWSAGQAQGSAKVSGATSTLTGTPPPLNTQIETPYGGSPTQRRRIVCSARLMDKDTLLVTACDPYTSEAYKARTGLPCETFSFKDVSLGQFPTYSRVSSPEEQLDIEEEETVQQKSTLYDVVICSFALHLLESPSEIWALLTALSQQAKWLVILEPHKKPEIKRGWGWGLWDAESWGFAEPSSPREILMDRVHCRTYRSLSDDGGVS